MADQERRAVSTPVECRATGETPGLSGYAALFGSVTEIAGMFREQIAPGAFRDAVGRDDVRALFNHDANFVLGRSTSGTLRLVEDDRGLRYDVDVPETTWARDLMVSVSRGDVSQSSFAFEVTEEEWDYGARGEMPLRTIKAVRLYDVSPVTYPAYASTSVSARAAQRAADVPAEWRQTRTARALTATRWATTRCVTGRPTSLRARRSASRSRENDAAWQRRRSHTADGTAVGGRAVSNVPAVAVQDDGAAVETERDCRNQVREV
jgi:uncharacterized protein